MNLNFGDAWKNKKSNRIAPVALHAKAVSAAGQLRAAGRFAAVSRMVFSTELGTCSKFSGSIE